MTEAPKPTLPDRRIQHWQQLAAMLARQRIDLVLDIGANVGQYASGLRTGGFASRILSVEPVASAHAGLAAAAAGDPHWEVAPRAVVGATRGTARINVSAHSDMSSLLAFTAEAANLHDGDRFVAQEDVHMLTVADLLRQHAKPADRIFLKSDTQGYEMEVLRGAKDSLDRIAGLQLEVSLKPIYEGQPGWRALVDLLTPHGFEIHHVVPGHFSRVQVRLIEMDLVFFRADG
jgi:FkbM family methyltransferase